jgi:peptide/nickel transport system ATP-binding protein
VTFEGRELATSARRRSAEDRRRIQYIFQNPYLSLNPRLTIEQIVRRPMELFGIAKGKEATDRVVALMEQVALGAGMLHYQASRLSGGERQRVAIARALAAEPDVMICDEITSALDVSVQGSIVALLEGLRKERGISMLFVTHNLALVRSIAAAVEILQDGRVVEAGSVVEVMETPREEYTRKLLSNSPRID